MKWEKTDVVIVGTGAAGLFAALHIPKEKRVCMITKDAAEQSDSFLAQGGICVLRDETDYESFLEDTLRAGHYENRRESVDIMIRSSREIVEELMNLGVEFTKENGELAYTKEGCHSKPRILFHQDITGKEITGTLLEQVRSSANITIQEHTALVDIITSGNRCVGILAEDPDGKMLAVEAPYTILATGGIGGLYENSTNYPHLTGDALAIALRHEVALEHLDYIQMHPTTLYSQKSGRRFLISESVRGEGAKLYGADGKRFADEVLPRDLLTKEIYKQMEKDKKPYVWLDMTVLEREEIFNHFPNIYQYCLEEGYDVTKDWIPVVPAQHYFMGGIRVDANSCSSMEGLYAVGETSCNGVHGANRLASNSLLESLVFAKRSAMHIQNKLTEETDSDEKKYAVAQSFSEADFQELVQKSEQNLLKEKEQRNRQYKQLVLEEIERVKQAK